MSKKTLFHYAAPAIITGMLFATVAVSWEEPGSNPPDGNAPAPINVSASNQSKEGWLTVGSTSAPSMQLDVQGIAPALGSLNVTGGAVLNTGGAATGLIVANGYVGIGTADPQERLHVAGDAVRITDSSAEIQFDQTNVSPNGDWLFKTFGNGLHIRAGDVDADSWSEKVIILNNGSVGIGTTNPLAQLQLEGDSGSAAEIALVHKGVGGSAGITFDVTNDTSPFYIKSNNNRLKFITSSGKAMTIMPSNRIGIGTIDPLNKLHVVGDTNLNPPIDARISVQNINAASKKSELCFSRPDTGAGAWCIGTDFWAQNDDDFFIWGGGADGGANQGRLYIDSTGNIGIGTNNPLAQLQLEGDSGSAAEIALVHKGVGGSAGITFDVTNDLDSFAIKAANNKLSFFTLNPVLSRMTILPNGNIGIGDADPTEAKLVVNGTAGNFTGVWSNLSDRRLKENIAPLESSLDKVLQLEGVGFEWKDQTRGEGLQRGFIAQDAQKVIPEWVRENDDGYLMLEKVGVEALLVEAIKEQQAQIEELKLEIEQLKK